MDQTAMGPGPELMGIPFTAVTFAGKLYVETLEGEILVKARRARLEILDTEGNTLAVMEDESQTGEICFALDGSVASVQYHLILQA